MTSTELREALDAVALAVEVPIVDQVAFQARVREERGRRTRRRLTVAGGVAAAAVVAGVALVVPGSTPERVPPTGRPVPSPDLTVPGQSYVPLLVHGQVVVLLPDGGTSAKRLPAEEVLGVGANGIVYVDRASHLQLLPVASSGEPGQPGEWTGPDPVESAALSGDGAWVAYRDTIGNVYLHDTFAGAAQATKGLAQGQLVATDGTGWLILDDGRLTLSGSAEPVFFRDSAPAVGGEVAGDTVAYQSAGGVVLFDVDGHQRYGDLGGAIGALSPDGRAYATAPDDDQRETERLAPTLRVIDTHDGTTTSIAGWDTDQHVLSMWWQSSDRFLVVTTDPQEPGHRLLWSCSVAGDTCGQVYDDPSGTLELPGG